MKIPDYYKMLQVRPDADLEIIQAAYRRLSRMYHPDTSDLLDANEKMTLLNKAYEVLSDPDKRVEYDKERTIHKQNSTPFSTSNQEDKDFEHEQDLETYGVSSASSSIEETTSIGLVWRTIIGIVAVILIGVFGYQFVLERQNSTGDIKITPAVEAAVAEPLATSQAAPDSAKAQFELANAYYESGQFSLAATAYQKAIELKPDYQAAYANLGATYYQQQQFELAVTQYEKALELKADDGESAYNLGAIYLQQALSPGEQPDLDLLNQAIEQIQNALQISPGLAEPHFSLGVAYTTLNQKAEAIQAFETFLSLNTTPNSQAEQAAQQYLQTLRGQ